LTAQQTQRTDISLV